MLINNMEINELILLSFYQEGFIKIILYLFRTDNSIKNHFYSTLRRSLRRINKLLGDKNSIFIIYFIK